MKVYSNNFKIKTELKVGEEIVTFFLRPLTYAQKTELGAKVTINSTNIDRANMVIDALKYSLVGIEGLSDENGKPWEVKREDGVSDQETIDMLMNIEELAPILLVCAKLIQGVPKEGEVKDQDGKVVPGITVKLGN